MGQGLSLALIRRGHPATLLARAPRAVVSPLSLHPGPWPEAVSASDLVVLATPDDAIAEVARALARLGMIASRHVVLHLSGVLDRSALDALEPGGAGLGSLHPLQTIADPATAPDRLRGAYAGVEGDSRALEAAEWLARAAGMRPVRVAGGAKPLYHAAAVFVSNYVVALAAVAERLGAAAGVAGDEAHRIYLPLLQGAVANIAREGAARALTGPVRRGDLRTIEAHLAALDRADERLYRELGLAALEVARAAGLDEETAAKVSAALGPPNDGH